MLSVSFVKAICVISRVHVFMVYKQLWEGFYGLCQYAPILHANMRMLSESWDFFLVVTYAM